MKETLRIGCGAGFSGDRLDPSVVLAEKGQLDFLVLECLAERTIALAQKRKQQDPSLGYDPLLVRRMESLLPLLQKNKVRLISNMGAANPVAAAKKTVDIARKLGLHIKVAAVSGDDVFALLGPDFDIIDSHLTSADIRNPISANAYLGIEGILAALETGADVIITGRVADPSLFLAPMIHTFQWDPGDFDLMGKGTVIGHLMECAGHITGGYFADPVKKPVDGLERLGHPFADISRDGSAIISKVEDTGGVVNLQAAKEQLLYEVINPYEYFTPDVIADFTTVQLKEIGENQVQVNGGTGKPKPATYKVSVGYQAFYLCEAEISYAGSSALERAKLAADILEKRLAARVDELRIDFIGLQAAHRQNPDDMVETLHVAPEIRLRAAGKAQTPEQAALVGEEVEALYTNGPAGGGGVRKYVNEVVGIVSTLMNRATIEHQVTVFES